MNHLLSKKSFAFVLALVLFVSSLTAMAAANEPDAAPIAPDELRLSDLPKHYIPLINVTAYSEAEANAIEAAGLDISRDQYDRFHNMWNYRIIVHEHNREFFETNNFEYVIVQDCITVRFEWWDNQFSPLPIGIAPASVSLPGIPGHPNNTGRPDLTVDPNAVFNPAGVSMNATFGFPDRTGYRTVTEYYAEMNYLAATYPETVQLHVLGTTYNGRPMVAMEISSDPGIDDGRPNSVHTGGTHAREWAGAEFSMKLAWYLITQYGKDDRITNILDTTRVWIMPLMNPDGMHWDQTNTPGSWRKNRRNNSDYNNGNPTTAAGWGVDLNRNFPYDFVLGQTNITGEDFRGPAPASEPEIAALLQVYLNNQIMTDTTGHTFGHFIIMQGGTHPNTVDIVALGEEIFQINGVDVQPSGDNANGQSVGWLFGTANTMSILSEYVHHNFVRPYMGEPSLSRFFALAPYKDYHGNPRLIPLAYRNFNIPGNSGAPAADITAPMAFLDNELYNGNPLTFRSSYTAGTLANGMQATVARVNSLGAIGGLQGKILVSIQAANQNTNRDVVLAAQNHGALAVIFVGGAATPNSWASTDFYVPGASLGGAQPIANFNPAPVGTTAEANAINIPVATSYRAAARGLHEWVKGGGTNMLTLTSTPADDPANAHLYPVMPGSILDFFYQYYPGFLHTIEAANRFSPYISGKIVCEKGELLPGASLALSIDVNSRIRQGSTILPAGTFVQTRRSRMDSTDGTFNWSVTPSAQRDYANDGYAITANANGRYNDTNVVHINHYKQLVDHVDFVLPKAIEVDYDEISVVGYDAIIPFSTYTLAASGKDSTKGFIGGMGELTATINGLPIEVVSLGEGDFIAKFKVEYPYHDVELVIDFDGGLPHSAYKAEFELKNNVIPITSIKIDALSITTVARGGVYNFDFILNEGATGKYVVWAIADPSLGYVDKAGNVTIFDKTGNVRLTATDPFNNVSHSITLRIAS